MWQCGQCDGCLCGDLDVEWEVLQSLSVEQRVLALHNAV